MGFLKRASKKVAMSNFGSAVDALGEMGETVTEESAAKQVEECAMLIDSLGLAYGDLSYEPEMLRLANRAMQQHPNAKSKRYIGILLGGYANKTGRTPEQLLEIMMGRN